MTSRAGVTRAAQRIRDVEQWRWIAAATMTAIVVMTVRELATGVVPVGDNSMIEVRSHDVFSRRPPLVNMLSTVASDLSVRHPGPLLFDLLAIPVRIGRHGRGLLVGVAIINCAVVWTTARTARRFLGPTETTVVAAASAVLVWSLGREILTEPWQPHVTLLSYLLLLVAGWGVAAGCDRCAIAAAFAFSFVLQTHASYVLVAPVVVLTAFAARFTLSRRLAIVRRPFAIGAAMTVVFWLQPVAQQLLGAGRGNLGAILDAAANDDPVLGLGDALRATTAVIAKPPFWLRPGIVDQLPIAERGLGDRLGGAAMDSGLLVPLVLAGLTTMLLAALVVWGRRDRGVVSGCVVIASALVAAITFIARLPVDPIFGFMVHKVRWLWPLGAFVATVVGVTAVRHMRRAAANVGQGLIAAVAIFSLVAASSSARGEASIAARFWSLYGVAADVRGSLDVLEDVGTVYIPFEHETVVDAFIETAIIAELVERGIPVRFTLSLAVAQYGDHYRLVARADVTLRVEIAPQAEASGGDVAFERPLELDSRDRELLNLGVGGEELVMRLIVEPFSWSHASD